MTEWLKQYWPYAIALVVVTIFAAFMVRKAAAAYRAHQKTFHEEEANMRRLVELKNKYGLLTEDVILQAPKDELLEGVALCYQLWLQKQPNPEAAFETLSPSQQNIYVLDVFVSDKTAQVFFKENGPLLKGRLCGALSMIGLHDADEQMQTLAAMFDENDETTSLSPAYIASADELFADMDLLTKIKLQSAEYICQHSSEFLPHFD